MGMTKCEFCDISLKSDLDVSRHLVSETHSENVKKAISLHPLEKSSLKEHHTHITKVFESLKLRTPKDVRDLADKNYFNLPPNNPELVGVADKLVLVFIKCIAERRTRTLSPKQRTLVMSSFDEPEREPLLEPRPGPSRPAAAPRPPEPQRPSKPDEPRPRVAPLPLQPSKTRPAEPQPAPKPVRTRPEKVPEPPVRVQPSERPRSSGPDRIRPTVQPLQPSGASFSSRPPAGSPPPKRKATEPSSPAPPPPAPAAAQTSKPGTVQPRKDSTFKPKFAIIKIEPKDD